MKTKHKSYKNIWLILLIGLTICFESSAKNRNSSVLNNEMQQDTASYFEVQGIIINKTSKTPVVFASIYIIGTNIGTVTNADGEFIIKIPLSQKSGKLGISFIGYDNKELAINQLDVKKSNIIMLDQSTIPLKEVVIRSNDPINLLLGALDRIPENYLGIPSRQTAFYRETIKQNRSYVAISEAVLDIYKAPYNKEYLNDQIKIYKGRKSKDVKKMDTILFKLQGGPSSTLLLDIAKNPGNLLTEEFADYYDFKLAGIININNKQNYLIEFYQKENIQYPLYNGKIYLDCENLAFTGVEFDLSIKKADEAAKMLVRKKPFSMKIKLQRAHYFVNYREIDNKWYFNYARSEVEFKCKWKKKLFSSNYTTMTEMAITDSEINNITRFRSKEVAKPTDFIVEKVGAFDDINFWGKYNYIKPDESIEAAIAKIKRKLDRINN